jgi:hypothetical protein
MACVFRAMLKMRVPKEKRDIETTSRKVLTEIPIPTSEMATSINPADSGILLSNLETSQPEIGRLIMEAIGMKIRIVPSSASLKPNDVLIVGILDAQEAKQKPESKKKTLSARRCRFFNSINSLRISDVLKSRCSNLYEWLLRILKKKKSSNLHRSQPYYESIFLLVYEKD